MIWDDEGFLMNIPGIVDGRMSLNWAGYSCY